MKIELNFNLVSVHGPRVPGGEVLKKLQDTPGVFVEECYALGEVFIVTGHWVREYATQSLPEIMQGWAKELDLFCVKVHAPVISTALAVTQSGDLYVPKTFIHYTREAA